MERPAGYSSLRRIGDVKPSFRLRDHDGWVLMDGRTIHRAVYPKFFDTVEITGETVVIPNGRDAMILGAGGRLKVMERGGANTVTLTIDNLPAHDHGFVDSTAEATNGKGGLLTGVLTVLQGIAGKTVDKTTAKTGKAAAVKIEPLAIGINYFVYVGQSM